MMSCKECTERHIGCHKDCERYNKEKYENDSMKRRIRQRMDKDRQQVRYNCPGFSRAKEE